MIDATVTLPEQTEKERPMFERTSITKYALFFRKRTIFVGDGLFTDSGGPDTWTLYNDQLFDTLDKATMAEMALRVADNHETTLTAVTIELPQDIALSAPESAS